MAKLTKEQLAGLTPDQRSQYNQLNSNLQSNAAGMIGGLAGVASSAIGAWNNVNPITGVSETANNINQVGNTQYAAGDLDNLLNQYTQSNNIQTTGMINYKAPTFGQYAQSALSGMAAGAQLGQSIEGTASAAGGMSDFAGSISAYGGPLHRYDLGGTIGGLVGAGLNLALTGINSAKQRKEAQNLQTRYDALNDYARQRNQNFFNNALQDSKSMMFNNAALQMKAFGGGIDTPANEGFDNGVRTINEGGTHEQNPYEGVPQGIAVDGKPNLVEEGEVIYNDYVFSNRLTLDKEEAEALHMKKGTTYADAAKQLQKESEERPNDPISKKGLNDSMTRLQEMQEAKKQAMQAEQAKEAINNMPPEQLMQLLQQAQVGAEAQEEAAQQQMQEQQMAEEAAMVQQMQGQEVPQQYAKGGHLFDGVSESSQMTLADLPAYTVKKPISVNDMYGTLGFYTPQPYYEPVELPHVYSPDPEIGKQPLHDNLTKIRENATRYKNRPVVGKKQPTEYVPSFEQSKLGTVMEYAPIAGSIGQALAAATREPDYSHWDAAQAAYNQIPYVNYKPVGIYTQYAEPSMNEQQNAIRNAIAANYYTNQNSAANSAAVNMLNLATSKALAENLGKARATDLAQVNAIREKQATNDYNVQNVNATAANATSQLNQERAEKIANAYSNFAEKRQVIDDALDANRQTTYANAFNNIGQLGKDIINQEYRNWLVNRGVYPGVTNDLDYDYTRIANNTKTKACGGKLKSKYNRRRK